MIKKRSLFLSLGAIIILIVFIVQYFNDEKDGISDIETENEWVQKVESDFELQNQFELMNLYSADIDTYETQIFMRVVIPKSYTTEEKFRLLMGKLGIYYFNIPIEDISFSIKNGKVLARVNLKEHPRNQSTVDVVNLIGENWAGQYFQGSAGSTITYNALVQTALQEEYLGSWIDGIEFVYNDKPIEFDHMLGISEIKWRK